MTERSASLRNVGAVFVANAGGDLTDVGGNLTDVPACVDEMPTCVSEIAICVHEICAWGATETTSASGRRNCGGATDLPVGDPTWHAPDRVSRVRVTVV